MSNCVSEEASRRLRQSNVKLMSIDILKNIVVNLKKKKIKSYCMI